MEVSHMAKGILEGDSLSLSRGLTLVESSLKGDIIQARELIGALLPHTGNSLRIGITGAPGVGKSTFIESFGLEILKNGLRVAILSVDPSSPATGGSILGDKTRMEKLSRSDSVFIRPTPSGKDHGGVGGNTRDQILLFEAAGYDIVLVETVGVGQGETAVSYLVDYLLLLMMAGGGDELQGIKRGIIEMAHAFAFTKKDAVSVKTLDKSTSDLKTALHVLNRVDSSIFTCSAIQNDGIKEIWDSINVFREKRIENGEWESLRAMQNLEYFDALLKRFLLLEILQDPTIRDRKKEYRQMITENKCTPMAAAEEIVRKYVRLN